MFGENNVHSASKSKNTHHLKRKRTNSSGPKVSKVAFYIRSKSWADILARIFRTKHIPSLVLNDIFQDIPFF